MSSKTLSNRRARHYDWSVRATLRRATLRRATGQSASARYALLGAAVVTATLAAPLPALAQAPAEGCCADRWDPARAERGHWEHGAMGPMQRQRMERHWTFMHEGAPAEYRGETNPLAATAENVDAGGRLYQSQCAMCHGVEGNGDGEAGRSLSPSPALLAHLVQRPMAVDEYLLWAIAEGGQAFGTAMPAFKGALSRDEIWQVVLYLRAGLPPVEATVSRR